LAWHPDGTLFSSEHGPSGENGWYAHDEINVIRPGGNYGWPHVIGISNSPNYIDPIISTENDTWAPSGITFYKGNKYPMWKGDLFITTLRGQHLRVIKFKKKDSWEVESNYPILKNSLGRLRDIGQGPDDFLYLCTNNRDGRGISSKGDDLILKITDPTKLTY
jgi:glucose/arabinose dehydrogenase